MKKEEINIKEVHNRNVLCEGRQCGIGFSLLLKLDDNNYTTAYHAFTPCKDFLNEPIFTENTGIPTEMYGCKVTKSKGVLNNDIVYLGINLLNQSDNTYNYNETKNINDDIEQLKSNYLNMQLLLNNIEEQLNIPLTIIEPANNGKYLVSFNKEWCKSTISISLYTLLLRAALYYPGNDIIDYLKSYNYSEDKFLINDMLPRLKVILENKMLPSQTPFDVDKIKAKRWMPHNTGILSWNMKYELETI